MLISNNIILIKYLDIILIEIDNEIRVIKSVFRRLDNRSTNCFTAIKNADF